MVALSPLVNGPPTVRLERAADTAQVRVVHERAFGRPDEANLVEVLRDSAGAVSLVALVDGRAVGHLLFTPVTVDGVAPAGSGTGLAPLAVLPEHQRQGIGSALVRAGLDVCRSLGHTFAVVLGHPEYYPRFGFVPASVRGLGCEFDVPAEAFMVLELRSGALDGARGVVHYRPEFADV